MSNVPVPDDYFDLAPVSLWLEDYSGLKRQFDTWREQGVEDLAEFLRQQPQWVARCWDLVRVLRVNAKTLELFGATDAQQLLSQWQQVLHSDQAQQASAPLLQLWNLTDAQRSFVAQLTNLRLDGSPMDVRTNATILPGHEHSWARVLTSMEDVTELRASETRMRQITDQIPGVVYKVHVSHAGRTTYLFVSAGVEELCGWTREEVMANGELLAGSIHPEDRVQLITLLDDAAHQRPPMRFEARLVTKQGAVKWVQLNSSFQSQDATGTVRNGVLLDVTARKRAELELREHEGLWKRALAATGDGMWEWRAGVGSRLYSSGGQGQFGYTAEEFAELSTRFVDLIHPDDVAQRERDREAYGKGQTPVFLNELRIRCKDGTWRWLLSRGVAVAVDEQGQHSYLIGTYTDISDRKRSEQVIWQQANFDPLTGLPNRRMLRDRMEQEILKGRRDGLQLALLFLDLDHFKEINDTLGHDRGDQLLLQAANRIRECVRESDTVARMGGDEFIVLIADLSDTAHLERIIQNILHALSQCFQLENEQVFVSASIGITMCPQDGTDVEALLKNGDQALYAAKNAGRNRFSFFTPSLQEATLRRVKLTNDLRHALGLGEFSLVYQPIIDLQSGAVHKAEALLRWNHPLRGAVSPAEFVPIAENSRLMVDIGDWVFQQAALALKHWRQSYHPDFQLSVNRSPMQFQVEQANRPSWTQLLHELGLPGEAMTVEITEGLLLDASPHVSHQLAALRESGIQISLDDFGTGYSSLSYLQRYDIDFIKIDQSFVRNLLPESTNLALCRAIIVMAHVLGMKVIAEGVETETQRDLLRTAECDFAQGYLFARPMDAQAMGAFLERQRCA